MKIKNLAKEFTQVDGYFSAEDAFRMPDVGVSGQQLYHSAIAATPVTFGGVGEI